MACRYDPRRGGEVSVFLNSQIKSAIDNVGTFGASNPDILYSYKDTDTRDLTPEQQALLVGLMAQGRRT